MTEERFPYHLTSRSLVFPDQTLEIVGLTDVEETIDQIFEILKNENRPELLNELCPYFGAIWPAAVGLTQFLARESSGLSSVEHSSFESIELGCGLALPSLYLAKKGLSAICTDQHPDVPAFLAKNRAANQVGSHLQYREFDWLRSENTVCSERDRVWFLASDILYESAHPVQVVAALKRLVTPQVERILIADQGRPYLQAFCQEMRRVLSVSAEMHVERCVSFHLGKEVFILDFKLSDRSERGQLESRGAGS